MTMQSNTQEVYIFRTKWASDLFLLSYWKIYVKWWSYFISSQLYSHVFYAHSWQEV